MKYLKTYKIFEYNKSAAIEAVNGIESNIVEVCDTLVDVFDKYGIHEHIPYTGNLPVQYTHDPNNSPPEEVMYWQYELIYDWTNGPPHRNIYDTKLKKYFKCGIEICNIPNEYRSNGKYEGVFKNILRDIKSLKSVVRQRTGNAIVISHEMVSGYNNTHMIKIQLSDRNRNIVKYNSFIHSMNDPMNQNPANHATGI